MGGTAVFLTSPLIEGAIFMANTELSLFLAQQQEVVDHAGELVGISRELDGDLQKGIGFVRSNKQGETGEFRLRTIQGAETNLAQEIVGRVNRVSQLAGLELGAMQLLVAQGLALTVERLTSSEGWVFAAYLGAEALTQEEVKWRAGRIDGGEAYCELRSSLTIIRGFGLNAVLKRAQMPRVAGVTGLLPCAFTDYIPEWGRHPVIESQAVKINAALGLVTIGISALPETLKAVMVQPCPPGRCFNRRDIDCPACGCNLWFPQVGNLLTTSTQSIMQ